MNEQRVRDQIREILITPSNRERGKRLSQLISIIASTGTDFNKWVRSIERKDLRDLLPPLAETLSVQEVPGSKPLIKSIFKRLSGHSAIGLFVKKEDQSLFSVDLKFQSDLDSQSISGELRNEIQLSLNARVNIEESGKKWLITDEKTYTIREREGQLNIYGAPHGILVPIDVMVVAGEGRNIVIPQAHILARAMPAIRTSAIEFINKVGWFGHYDKTKHDIYVHFGEPINTPPLNGALDGPSLGLLIGILIVCHFCESTLPPTVSATGELTDPDSVGPVNGVFAKVRAAVDEGDITQVFTPGLTDEEKAELGDYRPYVQEVGNLEGAINALCLPTLSGISKNITVYQRSVQSMQANSIIARLGSSGEKMTLAQAIKEASFRVVLEGGRNGTHQVLREICAYYIENAEEKQILPCA